VILVQGHREWSITLSNKCKYRKFLYQRLSCRTVGGWPLVQKPGPARSQTPQALPGSIPRADIPKLTSVVETSVSTSGLSSAGTAVARYNIYRRPQRRSAYTYPAPPRSPPRGPAGTTRTKGGVLLFLIFRAASKILVIIRGGQPHASPPN